MATAATLYFGSSMTAKDRDQGSKVDAVLRLVERAICAHETAQACVLAGQVRVDDLVKGSLPQPGGQDTPRNGQ